MKPTEKVLLNYTPYSGVDVDKLFTIVPKEPKIAEKIKFVPLDVEAMKKLIEVSKPIETPIFFVGN